MVVSGRRVFGHRNLARLHRPHDQHVAVCPLDDLGRDRAEQAGIPIITDADLQYFTKLTSILKTAARFQFLGRYLKGEAGYAAYLTGAVAQERYVEPGLVTLAEK